MTTSRPAPPGSSAITLWVVRRSETARTRTPTRRPSARASRRPVAKLAETAGIRAPGPTRLPGMVPRRPGRPSLKMIAATAPARAALSTLVRRRQPPRSTSTTSPRRTEA